MKKLTVGLLLWAFIFCQLILASEIIIENATLTSTTNRSYTQFQVADGSTDYWEKPGYPSIPLRKHIIELPVGTRITELEIIPRNIEMQKLSSELAPVPQNVPFSFQGPFPETKSFSAYQTLQPENWLIHKQEQKLAGKTLCFLDIAAFQYDPQQNQIAIPQQFVIRWTEQPTNSNSIVSENFASQSIRKSFQLPHSTRNNEQPGYLLIYPEAFQEAYQPLLQWRRQQGFRVFEANIESISANYEGRDLAERLRNYIQEIYADETISFVTLGSDLQFIPSRTVFAFDCAYGYAYENDIQADMYFACLDGDWDANQNDVFGEEADEIDLLPEIFIGRIPALSVSDVDHYVERLIAYEKGQHADYQKAAGFSANLWDEADSELCQQFIYEKFFPSDFSVEMLIDDENDVSSASILLAQNPNIAQHTGHAWYTSLSLGNGSFGYENARYLGNEYAGIFYSIGCWSAALDYAAIGELMVCPETGGFLGYVGNSRYGWGAPSAPAFGFSEFFQKEFFRLLFQENEPYLGALNARQKLPFAHYCHNTSVYKWITYQLNALGDAAFRMQTTAPLPLECSIQQREETILVQVTSQGNPVTDAWVNWGNHQAQTNYNGEVTFPISDFTDSESLVVYKPDYQSYEILFSPNGIDQVQIDILENDLENPIIQDEHFSVQTKLLNNSENTINAIVQLETNQSYIEIKKDHFEIQLNPYEQIELETFRFQLKSTDETDEILPNDYMIPIKMSVFNNEHQLLAQRTFALHVGAPQMELQSLQWELVTDPSLEKRGILSGKIVNSGNVNSSAFNLIVLPTEWEPREKIQRFSNLAPNDRTDFSVSFALPQDSTALHYVDLRLHCSDRFFDQRIYVPLTAQTISFEETFEDSTLLSLTSPWQQTNTYAADGEFCLSCRPNRTGSFAVDFPSFAYYPGAILAFDYKYKVPMYGEDGIFFDIFQQGVGETLLFLGSGGALPINLREAQVYIEDDWQHYEINLENALLNPPQPGDFFHLQLRFFTAERIPGFNTYNSMPEIGVFLDNLQLQIPSSAMTIEEKTLPINFAQTRIFPNPIRAYDHSNIQFFLENQQNAKIAIYNIKGQLVQTFDYQAEESGLHTCYWNGENQLGETVSSGIYLVRISTPWTSKTKKITLLK